MVTETIQRVTHSSRIDAFFRTIVMASPLIRCPFKDVIWWTENIRPSIPHLTLATYLNYDALWTSNDAVKLRMVAPNVCVCVWQHKYTIFRMVDEQITQQKNNALPI